MDQSQRYADVHRREILKLSDEKEDFSSAVQEWDFQSMNQSTTGFCICGKDIITEYLMKNMINDNEARIGSDCREHFPSNVADKINLAHKNMLRARINKPPLKYCNICNKVMKHDSPQDAHKKCTRRQEEELSRIREIERRRWEAEEHHKRNLQDVNRDKFCKFCDTENIAGERYHKKCLYKAQEEMRTRYEENHRIKEDLRRRDSDIMAKINKAVNVIATAARNKKLTQWEQRFINSILEQIKDRHSLSNKQKETIRNIFK